MRRPKSKPHTQASRSSYEVVLYDGIELQVRSSSTTTDTTYESQTSEADLFIKKLVKSNLPDPDIDDDEISKSSTALIENVIGNVSSTGPSVDEVVSPGVDDLVNQAIAAVPFPDEFLLDETDSFEPDPFDDIDEVLPKTGSQAAAFVDASSSTRASLDELVIQAIAGVPFPDEFPPDKTDPLEPGPLDITGPVSPRTGAFVDDVISAETEVVPKAGSGAAAFVDGIISSVTDGGVNANGAKEISRDSDDFDVLGDKQEKVQLGEHAQSLLEQVVNSSVGLQDIETSYTGKNTAEELLPPPPGEGVKQPIVIPADLSY